MSKVKIAPGEPAPLFEGRASDGQLYRQADLLGRPLVIFFYPKAGTPNCTREACAFRDQYEPLRRRGALLLGVSLDSRESIERFATTHTLPFPLISDPGGEIVTAFDAWQPWAFFRSAIFVNRMTVLIEPTGLIRRVWRNAHPIRHVEEVIATLDLLAHESSSAETQV